MLRRNEEPLMGAADIEPYYRIAKAGAPIYASNSGRLAFVSDRSGTPQLWETSDGGQPVQSTFSSGRGGGAPYLMLLSDRRRRAGYSPVSDDLIFVADEGGNEHYQMFRLKERTHQIEPVSHHAGAMH